MGVRSHWYVIIDNIRSDDYLVAAIEASMARVTLAMACSLLNSSGSFEGRKTTSK